MYFIKNSVNAETKVVLPGPVFPITFIDHPNVFGTKSSFIELTGCFIQSVLSNPVFKNDKYEHVHRRGLINIIAIDNNYFLVSYAYGVHITIALGAAAILQHLSPITFHLLNKKTGLYFKEWNLMSFSSI